MRYVFFETPLFTRLLPDYLDEEAYRALQMELMRWPERGDVIKSTGGFRKLRFADRRRGKGKRGGLRVVYYVLERERQIWLFTIYGKGEVADLTAEECRLLRNAIRDELRDRRSSL